MGMRGLLYVCVACVGIAGCKSTYDGRFEYQPKPMEVAMPSPGGGPAVRALGTIIGMRNADEEAGTPRAIEVRLRLENLSDQPVRFDPRSMQVISADLKAFGPPIVTPADPLTIAPRQAVDVTPLFPVPEGRVDLDGLNVRWTVEVNSQPVIASATFNRQQWQVIEDDRPRFHFGVGTMHRW